MEFYDNTNSVNLSDENVKSISLDSNVKDVINTFGNPNKVEEIEYPLSKYYIYNGIEFGINEAKVIRYYFREEYQTARGLTVGDASEKAIKAYGKYYYERDDTGSDIIGILTRKIW